MEHSTGTTPKKLDAETRATLTEAHRILVQHRENVNRAISALFRLEMSAPSAEVAERIARAILAEYEPKSAPSQPEEEG